MFKAFVIEVDPDKDCGDVVQIARTLGKVAFRTEKKVRVVRIIADPEIGYIAVVENPEKEAKTLKEGCTNLADVSQRKTETR